MPSTPVRIGLIGTGRIGSSHAQVIARRVPGARLVAVGDARPGAADQLASQLGCRATDPAGILADPDVEAVVITASSPAHADLIVAAAAAGKAIFCEKPMSMTVKDADRSIEAARNVGVPLQVGFNRRFATDFAAARGRSWPPAGSGRHNSCDRSRVIPAGEPCWGPALDDLPPDPHPRLRCLLWLNPGAEATTVHATADALVAPVFKSSGLLDTAVVVITFDNGAIATAEASFSAAYGYDVRGEVFGSDGMVTMGGGARSSMVHARPRGATPDDP